MNSLDHALKLHDQIKKAFDRVQNEKATSDDHALINNLHVWRALWTHIPSLSLVLTKEVVSTLDNAPLFAAFLVQAGHTAAPAPIQDDDGWDSDTVETTDWLVEIPGKWWKLLTSHHAVRTIKVAEQFLRGVPNHSNTTEINSRFFSCLSAPVWFEGALALWDSKISLHCQSVFVHRLLTDETHPWPVRVQWLKQSIDKGLDVYNLRLSDFNPFTHLALFPDKAEDVFALGFDPHQLPPAIFRNAMDKREMLIERFVAWQAHTLHTAVRDHPGLSTAPRKM